jgi:hypothetical protein
LTLETPGIPRNADGSPNLTAPAPKAGDGYTDLSGLWRGVGVRGDLRDESKIQPWARAAMAEHESNYYRDGAHMQCWPQGPAYLGGAGGGGGGMRRFVQSPGVIAVLHSDGTYRQIFTDGRALEQDPLPIFQGYSVGRWDGDTLVVETRGLNGKQWLDHGGLPTSDKLTVIEKFRRPNVGRLEIELTITDPTYYTKPWTATTNARLLLGTELFEFICNENEKSSEHMGPHIK